MICNISVFPFPCSRRPVVGQVDAFRVDGIPHLAMVNSKGEVETAIIGTVPKNVSTRSVSDGGAKNTIEIFCVLA